MYLKVSPNHLKVSVIHGHGLFKRLTKSIIPLPPTHHQKLKKDIEGIVDTARFEPNKQLLNQFVQLTPSAVVR